MATPNEETPLDPGRIPLRIYVEWSEAGATDEGASIEKTLRSLITDEFPKILADQLRLTLGRPVIVEVEPLESGSLWEIVTVVVAGAKAYKEYWQLGAFVAGQAAFVLGLMLRKAKAPHRAGLRGEVVLLQIPPGFTGLLVLPAQVIHNPPPPMPPTSVSETLLYVLCATQVIMVAALIWMAMRGH